MNCKQARRQITDMAKLDEETPALSQHLERCSPCGVLLEERRALHVAFAQLRDEAAGASPSARVEEHVLAALNGNRRIGPEHWNGWRLSVAGLIAATLIAAILIAVHRNRPALPAQAALAPAEAPFTAMPYVIPPAPYERTAVVRTEVPLQIMLAAGFQVHGGELGSSTKADVLYGEDGRILAIRLISQPQDISTKRMD